MHAMPSYTLPKNPYNGHDCTQHMPDPKGQICYHDPPLRRS
uniref:Protein CTR9 homolog n=1 Tax=Rhizophora mucronata TaxID=61149 RepID=A0A2P2LK55_RHIMU